MLFWELMGLTSQELDRLLRFVFSSTYHFCISMAIFSATTVSSELRIMVIFGTRISDDTWSYFESPQPLLNLFHSEPGNGLWKRKADTALRHCSVGVISNNCKIVLVAILCWWHRYFWKLVLEPCMKCDASCLHQVAMLDWFCQIINFYHCKLYMNLCISV